MRPDEHGGTRRSSAFRSSCCVRFLVTPGGAPLPASPGAEGAEEGGIAPGQVGDTQLIAGGLVELLAQLEAIAVVDDRIEHAVTCGP